MKYKLWLVLLVTISFLIRMVCVSHYPPLLWDETSLGYNAYSIMETGRDEYGKLMPLIFKSFGDYKPGLYVYLAVPFVGILGLNALAVRLPSIILGSLLPVFLYLLVKEIFIDGKLAFWSAFSLVFLPWAIHFSRGAWEVNAMTSFLVLGSYLLLKGLKAKSVDKKFKSWGLLFFLLALWTYQGAKMLVPLILLGLLFLMPEKFLRIEWKEEKNGPIFSIWQMGQNIAANIWKQFGIWCLAFGILATLWYIQSFSGSASNRLKVMSLLSYRRPVEEVNKILQWNNLDAKDWHFYAFHGEWLAYSRAFLDRYFNYFSPRFLAFAGDWNNPRHSAPYFGMIGHVNYVLFLLGLAYFLSRRHKRLGYFFFYWLAIAPLPAALSRDVVSGVRSLAMVVPLSFFIGYGINFLMSGVGIRNRRPATNLKLQIVRVGMGGLKCAVLLFLALDFIYWSDLYFIHMVRKYPKDWLYGYKQVAEYVANNHENFNKVLLTNFYGQPYIYYLFYSKYPPRRYQREAKLVENKFGDVGKVEKIGNVSFTSLDKSSLDNCRRCLLVFSQDEILRSGIDKDRQLFAKLKPLGEIGRQATFYSYNN